MPSGSTWNPGRIGNSTPSNPRSATNLANSGSVLFFHGFVNTVYEILITSPFPERQTISCHLSSVSCHFLRLTVPADLLVPGSHIPGQPVDPFSLLISQIHFFTRISGQIR